MAKSNQGKGSSTLLPLPFPFFSLPRPHSEPEGGEREKGHASNKYFFTIMLTWMVGLCQRRRGEGKVFLLSKDM